jgi:hypothetical protein
LLQPWHLAKLPTDPPRRIAMRMLFRRGDPYFSLMMY